MLVELSGIIKTFLDNKNWSAAHLARQCGLSGSTLLRIIHKEQVPKLETVKAILSVVCTYQEAAVFLAKFWPEKAECLKETSRESYKIDQDAMDFFYRNMFTLQLLCLAKAGLSVRKASKILGSHSHYIEDALNEGFLSEKNGKLMVADFATLKTFDLVKALRIVCDYQETVVDNPPSVVTFKNLSGNEVAQQMLREGMRD